jgi:hypothetical protein
MSIGGLKTATELTRCLIDCVNQQLCRKRLMKACNATYFRSFSMSGLIVNACDEYSWKCGTRGSQSTPQLDAGNATQINIQHEAFRFTRDGALKECFGRNVCCRVKAHRAQQTLDRFQHCRVVINDRDDLSPN